MQRGLVRWFLSLHSPKHSYAISPRKLPKAPSDDDSQKPKEAELSQGNTQRDTMDIDSNSQNQRAVTPDASSITPGPINRTPKTPVRGRKKAGSDDGDVDLPAPPPAFTPSINRTLNKILPIQYQPPPLPEGLTIKELQVRSEGKKKIKLVNYYTAG